MSEVTEISQEYFKINPVNVLETLDDIEVPAVVEINTPLNENVTDIAKSDLIRRVFENKSLSLIRKRKLNKFDEGGASSGDQEVWTPYEFLHELLPQIYGKIKEIY